MKRNGQLGWCIALLAAITGAFTGCRPPAPPSSPSTEGAAPASWFKDVTDEVGLRFIQDPGPTGKYFMPQIAGSGAALFDYDNDGRLDILLLQNAGPGSSSTNRLFHQEADGRFTDVSKGSGLDIAGYNMGVAVADVNNDGLPDVLITQYGGARLFLNDGNGHFTEVTKAAGLDHAHWATSAAFLDYDRDGWLDLVVVSYVDYDSTVPCKDLAGKIDYCSPSSHPGSVSRLYRNLGRTPDGKSVRFEDVSFKSGLGRTPGPGLGVVCADFNGDRWPDILIANDGKPNHLWINQKDGTFKEEAVIRQIAYNGMGNAQAGMGIALGDVNGDGLLDVLMTHLTWESHTLWLQGPRGLFKDRTAASDLLRAGWRSTGFGTCFGDFDHDGSLDLAIVNGRIIRGPTDANPQLGPYWSVYAERNQLFAGDGKGRFRDISTANAPFCATPQVARGLAVGDVDGDGALDLLVTNIAAPARLYRNVVAQRGHWLLVRALDPVLKRDAYGAEVILTVGQRRRVGLIQAAGSYLCSTDPRAHFGLGPVDEFDSITVLWPDGKDEVFPGGKADRVVVVRKGQGAAAPPQ